MHVDLLIYFDIQTLNPIYICIYIYTYYIYIDIHTHADIIYICMTLNPRCLRRLRPCFAHGAEPGSGSWFVVWGFRGFRV